MKFDKITSDCQRSLTEILFHFKKVETYKNSSYHIIFYQTRSNDFHIIICQRLTIQEDC
jgi:hypothetical protein